MSSGRTGLVTGRLHRVLPHAPVDLVRDPATKSSHSLLLGVTACPSVLDVVVSPPAEPHLGKSDAVEHQDLRYSLQDHLAVKRAVRHIEIRVELVKEPSKSVLNSGSLADEIVAVVEQQLDLAAFALQLRDREVALP